MHHNEELLLLFRWRSCATWTSSENKFYRVVGWCIYSLYGVTTINITVELRMTAGCVFSSLCENGRINCGKFELDSFMFTLVLHFYFVYCWALHITVCQPSYKVSVYATTSIITAPPPTTTPVSTPSSTPKTAASTTTKATVLTTIIRSTATTETMSPVPTATSATPPVCGCVDLKNRKRWACGETWTEDCFHKSCMNGKIILASVACPVPVIPSCPRGQVTKVSDGCCDTWKCDCTWFWFLCLIF